MKAWINWYDFAFVFGILTGAFFAHGLYWWAVLVALAGGAILNRRGNAA